MANSTAVDDVRAAYGRRAEEYADLACSPEWMAEHDRSGRRAASIRVGDPTPPSWLGGR